MNQEIEPKIECPNCTYDGGSHYFAFDEHDDCPICRNARSVDERGLFGYAYRVQIIEDAIAKGEYKPIKREKVSGINPLDYF